MVVNHLWVLGTKSGSSTRATNTLNCWIIFSSLKNVCISFFCMYICVPLACLVLAEARIEHQIPWNELQLEANMLVLRLELSPLEEQQFS